MPVLPSPDPSFGVWSTPAQFTSTFTSPYRSEAAANIESMALLSLTSQAHAIASGPPAATMASTVDFAAPSSRSWHTTDAPSAANA